MTTGLERIGEAARDATNRGVGHMRPISKDTIRARVYLELKRAVLSGGFEPGESIVARVIAERMGVGQMPVRESIQQLVTEGGFEILPNRTVRVPVLDRRKLRDIFDIRIELEALAARKAAAVITEAEIGALRACSAEVVPAVEAAPAAALAANYQFHFRLYEAAASPVLYTIIEGLWLKVGPLLILRFRQPERGQLRDSLVEHERLLEALERHDGPAAAVAMTGILSLSLQWYETVGLS